MDKLRPTIEAIKKYHFWVLCGALVLTVLVCWWMSTSGMAEQFNTQESKIKNAFSGVQGIQSGHPNQRTIDEIKKRDAELKQNVFEAWEVLYKEQKEKNPFPTEELGEDFQRQFETLRPQEELARRYRERYQNFIKERLPKLKICMAHGGGSFPYTIGRIEHGFNMRPDLVATDNPRNPREYLDRFYFDSWVADPRALQYLLDTCGAERVMLGTDYPFPLGEQTPGAGIDAMDLDEAGKARLFHGTALEWLGLPKSRFA